MLLIELLVHVLHLAMLLTLSHMTTVLPITDEGIFLPLDLWLRKGTHADQWKMGESDSVLFKPRP